VHAKFLYFSRGRYLLVCQDLQQPGSSQEPQAIGGTAAQAHHFGGLLVLEAGEESQFHQGGGLRIVPLELCERLVDCQQIVKPFVRNRQILVEVQTPGLTASLVPAPASCPFDQDSAHGLGGGAEEVSPAIPVLLGAVANQPQVRFVHQGRSLKRLAGPFLRQPLSGEAAQLIVDKRQELVGSVWVAGVNGVQDARDIAHESQFTMRNSKSLYSSRLTNSYFLAKIDI
jgi:hypothetical protein